MTFEIHSIPSETMTEVANARYSSLRQDADLKSIDGVDTSEQPLNIGVPNRGMGEERENLTPQQSKRKEHNRIA